MENHVSHSHITRIYTAPLYCLNSKIHTEAAPANSPAGDRNYKIRLRSIRQISSIPVAVFQTVSDCNSVTIRTSRISLWLDRKSTRLNSSHANNLVCRLLLEKKKKKKTHIIFTNHLNNSNIYNTIRVLC